MWYIILNSAPTAYRLLIWQLHSILMAKLIIRVRCTIFFFVTMFLVSISTNAAVVLESESSTFYSFTDQ